MKDSQTSEHVTTLDIRRAANSVYLGMDEPVAESLSKVLNGAADEIERLREAVEEICQHRGTAPITRSRLRHALAGIDWRKAK